MPTTSSHSAPVIPIHAVTAAPANTAPDAAVSPALRDALARPLRDLRISVTDRCNFRCSYCMPKSIFGRDHVFLPQSDLLSFEEITRMAEASVLLGVRKIRITGGEPLLRKNLEILIAQLASLRTPEGEPLDITLTTNATLLARKAQALKDAGLKRITVSLDALDDAVFQRMNDMGVPVADVLRGIEAAQAVGLADIKVNMVVQKGVNDDQILPMARHFRGSGITLRFIEFMDVGETNGWAMDQVLPSAEVIARIHADMPLVALPAKTSGETAQRWAYANADGVVQADLGEIGVISSVTQAFCGECNRARLSTEGKLYTCLFATRGTDLRPLVREGADAATLAQALANIWAPRDDRYSLLRAQGMVPDGPRIEMHYIGG